MKLGGCLFWERPSFFKRIFREVSGVRHIPTAHRLGVMRCSTSLWIVRPSLFGEFSPWEGRTMDWRFLLEIHHSVSEVWIRQFKKLDICNVPLMIIYRWFFRESPQKFFKRMGNSNPDMLMIHLAPLSCQAWISRIPRAFWVEAWEIWAANFHGADSGEMSLYDFGHQDHFGSFWITRKGTICGWL